MHSAIGNIIEQGAKTLGINISESEIGAFERYAVELKKWNGKVNLTAITKDSEIAIKHFLDSLSLFPYIKNDDLLLDIGSGAGMPIIPLKIIMPNIQMVSVDAVSKKINFQRHIIRTLQLSNIEAIHARVENLNSTHHHFFSVITSRAFTRLDRFVALASPLLAKGGTLIAMKGEQADDEISQSDDMVHGAGFSITSVQRYELPQNMGKRVLTLLKRTEIP